MADNPEADWQAAMLAPAGRGPYLLGVDGGGTKTTALLVGVDGQVLGRGSAGGSNLKSLGQAAALAAVRAAVSAAYAAAGLPLQLPRAACLGLSGLDDPNDQQRLQVWAERALTGRPVRVVNDVELVLAAGTPAGWGIGVIAGTGAIAFGRTPEGRTVRVGGWGWVMGDEGSGYALGQAALQAVARAADGRGPQTALTAMILSQWSLAAPAALLPVVYQTPLPRTQIAALAALVEAAASTGDTVAARLTSDSGRELALAAISVTHTLGLTSPVPAALAGGVLVKAQSVRRAFIESLAAVGIALEPLQLVEEPAQGAIVLARRLAATLGE
jgi:N-acetylglucosamine kinase-like BadF-type ATPase